MSSCVVIVPLMFPIGLSSMRMMAILEGSETMRTIDIIKMLNESYFLMTSLSCLFKIFFCVFCFLDHFCLTFSDSYHYVCNFPMMLYVNGQFVYIMS